MNTVSRRIVFLLWLGFHANVCVICMIICGSLFIQFVWKEFPCPLCMTQRISMVLCAMAQASMICSIRLERRLHWRNFVLGQGMTLCAALAGACMSIRQILLHIVPPDPGYGTPIFGLHIYTWALLVFVAEIVVVTINLLLAPKNTEEIELPFGWFSRTVLVLFAVAILGLAVGTFIEQGFHWRLPDNPERNELLYDLGFKRC